MYFFPIWSISLEAPQYPEGLGLYINISSMVGHRANDLNSINNLNHYIGMKIIKPESINELKIMPYIIGFMMLFGVIILFINKKKLIWIWIIIFIIIAFIGLYDFYLWGYDYGHNLDPKAIIKIPGMFYQPPVFGTKQLLNFTAHSYPSIGGIAAFLSIVIAFFSLDVVKMKKGKDKV
jgi:copper chaperone NosL